MFLTRIPNPSFNIICIGFNIKFNINIKFYRFEYKRPCRFNDLQLFTKYFRLTLVFVWTSALREKFNLYFSRFLPLVLTKLAGGMGARLPFYEVWTLSWYFLVSEDPKTYVVRQLVRQLVYTMFISNNRASFQFWRKENLVKHQRVSQYYENDCFTLYLYSFNGFHHSTWVNVKLISTERPSQDFSRKFIICEISSLKKNC